MEITLTNSNDAGALEFPWGAIKWLCNDQIDPEAEMTFRGRLHQRWRRESDPLSSKL